MTDDVQAGRRQNEAGSESSITGLIALYSIVTKNWPAVLASCLLGLGGGVLATRMTAPVYQATATVEFDPNPVQPLADKTGDGFTNYVRFLNSAESQATQYRIITSERVMSRAAEEAGLTGDPEFAPKQLSGAPAPMEEISARLRARTTVEPVKGTRLFVVRVEDTSAPRARRLADAIVSAYLAQNADKSVAATSEAVVWLDGQVDHYKKELEASENALHDFKARNELPSMSISEVANSARIEMQAYLEETTKTRSQRQAIEARAKELASIPTDQPDLIPASELLSNASLQSLRSEYHVALREQTRLMAEGKGENHPEFRKATQTVAVAKTALLAEIKNIQGAVQSDLAIITRQEGGDNGLYEQARRRAVDINMKEVEYHRLDRSREQNEKLYAMLTDRLKQADLARMMNVSGVRMLDAASEPKAPVRPRPAVNMGIGLLFGLLVGLAFTALREILDSSIKTPDDIEERLGATFLGLLPEVSQGTPGRSKRRRAAPSDPAKENPPELVVFDRPLSGIAEAARTLRTNLMFMNPDRPFRVLLVSSAAPSEGKTTVTCSLAIALAQTGRRVCIVDCDLRRPRLHRIFDRIGDPGLTSMLIGEATLDEVAKPTKVENLWAVPAGAIPPNPADLLQSETFRATIALLRERFDTVIIDTPPLVAVTDSAVISTVVDGALFVVRAFKTSRQLARQGLRALRDVDARIVGVVLNAVNLNKLHYNYYYHYHYYKDGYLAAAEARSEGRGQPPSSDQEEGASSSPSSLN